MRGEIKRAWSFAFQGSPPRGASAVRTLGAQMRDGQALGADSRFDGLLEAAPDAIVGVDPAGRIVLVNGQAERLFGYAREELIGEQVEVLVPEAARGVHPDRRASYLRDPKPRPMGAGMELAGRGKDGRELP